MADPSFSNPTDAVGSSEVGAAAAAGGVICSICGKMKRTVPIRVSDAHEYCECETHTSPGMESLPIRVRNATITAAQRFISIHQQHTSGQIDIPELIPAAEEPDPKDIGLPEKLILEGLIPEDYNPPPSQEAAEECSICKKTFKNGHVLGRILCTHKFHFHCIKTWLVERNFCLNCKKIAIEVPPLSQS